MTSVFSNNNKTITLWSRKNNKQELVMSLTKLVKRYNTMNYECVIVKLLLKPNFKPRFFVMIHWSIEGGPRGPCPPPLKVVKV